MAMPSYLAGGMPLAGLNGPGSLSPLMAMELPDHHSNFDTDTYVGSEDAMTFSAPPLPPSHQQLKRYPSTYDDPFSDAPSIQDTPQRDSNGVENTSIERDNKLLSFGLPTFNYTLIDYNGMSTSISLSAHLHGMFFLAESPWAAAGDASAPPTELTCYRRNLFQITGSITLPRALRCIMTDQGDRIPILGQELSVSATESVEGNPVKIISVPWKTPASNTAAIEDKTEKEPPMQPLDLLGNPEVESDFVTYPIAWKRLQFRIATANNGRRKELQQHFVVRLKVMATLATGGKISICEAQSGPVIVRGRSPRNFQSRKDLPLNGGASSSRKGQQQGPSAPTRTSTGDSGPPQQQQQQMPASEPTVAPDPSQQQTSFQQYDRNDLQLSPSFMEWMKISNQHAGPLTAIPTPTSYPKNPQPHTSPLYAQSSPEASRPSTLSSQPPPSVPISLSLTDDLPQSTPSRSKRQQQRSNSSSSPRGGPPTTASSIRTSNKTPRISHAALPTPSKQATNFSFTHNTAIKFIGSPDESADLLYEYFPLGLDDWMPPVDAVYRPHVVHHTNLPSDPKALAVKNRSKRYFSEDQP
ncbi:MAG: hypothetical protein M1819_007345 [Sarea resinae]|nr:MAG: hypothetical protein M1819_007345 [Sarea resinae]